MLEYEPEIDVFETESLETDDEAWSEEQEPLGDAEVMELAARLLEVANEQELDDFLGDVLKKAASAVGSAVKSPVGRALGGILKGAAKKALPGIGRAIGGQIGGASGARIGGRIASHAGSLLGLETEGLSEEDEVFELAKQYVRFAAEAGKNAALAPSGDPRAIASVAAGQAARRLAPGLVSGAASRARAGAARSGRWVRRGNRIILYGV
jgi:hypothetical protein